MKSITIIGAILILSLAGCDKLKEQLEVETNGWEYTAKVDKITQNKSVMATRQFTDTEVDFARVDVDITCTNHDKLTATITTYDNRADEDGNINGVTMQGGNWLTGTRQGDRRVTDKELHAISTRSGKNVIRYFVSMPKYNNQMEFDVAHPQGGDFSIHGIMVFHPELSIPEESASLMISNEWIMRVETTLGNPTITIDLNDPAVKKVIDQCKWKPAFIVGPVNTP